MRALDYTAAAASPDPLAADPPFQPSYEDRPGAPDQVFTTVGDSDYERLVAAWEDELERAGAGDADVLHLHHLTPIHEAAERRFPDVPRIGHLHGTELLMLQEIEEGPPAHWTYATQWAERLRRWARGCERLLVLSPDAVRRVPDLLGVDPQRIVWAPNGFDPAGFDRRPQEGEARLAQWRHWLVEEPRGWDESGKPGSVAYTEEQLEPFRGGGPVMLYVGRYTEVKRIPLMIRAHARARERFDHPAPLVLLGGFPGEWEGEHPLEVVRETADPDVFLAGWRGHDDLPQGLNAADLLVLALGARAVRRGDRRGDGLRTARAGGQCVRAGGDHRRRRDGVAGAPGRRGRPGRCPRRGGQRQRRATPPGAARLRGCPRALLVARPGEGPRAGLPRGGGGQATVRGRPYAHRDLSAHRLNYRRARRASGRAWRRPRYSPMLPASTAPAGLPAAPSRSPKHDGNFAGDHLSAIPYRIRRSPKARRARILVDGGGVEVVLPRRFPLSEVEPFVEEKRAWIERTLRRMQETEVELPPARLADGGELPFLGRRLTLAVRREPGRVREHAALRGHTLRVALPAQAALRDAVERWYRRRARDEVTPLLDAACARAGTSYAGLQVRGQRTRWASCSSTGVMSFNWRLLLAPPEILAYVVEHEVAHLEVLDHSPRFWSLLGVPLPGLAGARGLAAPARARAAAVAPSVMRLRPTR